MADSACIAVLSVGKLDDEHVRRQYEAILDCLKLQGLNLFIADPVLDEENARKKIQEFSKYDPDLILIITLQGLSAQIIEAACRESVVPCLIWPVQGRYALPSSALAAGALRERGIPVELLYAPPDLLVAIEKVRCFTRAAKAYTRLRKSRIGLVGGLFENLVSCRYDAQKINARLGVTLLPISYPEIRNSIQHISQNIGQIDEWHSKISNSFKVIGSNKNALDAGICLHLALKMIAVEYNLNAFATECWSGLPRELGMNPCLGFVEDEYTLACEGDVMLSAALLIVRLLTGKSAYVGDLYDLDLEGIVSLVHCGAPASLASAPRDVVITKSQLAMERGFETMTCRPLLETGPVTLLRFYGQECDKMHIAMGEMLSSDSSGDLLVKVKLTGSRWDFLEQCLGNHYIAAGGDIRNELRMLAKWFGITLFET